MINKAQSLGGTFDLFAICGDTCQGLTVSLLSIKQIQPLNATDVTCSCLLHAQTLNWAEDTEDVKGIPARYTTCGCEKLSQMDAHCQLNINDEVAVQVLGRLHDDAVFFSIVLSRGLMSNKL